MHDANRENGESESTRRPKSISGYLILLTLIGASIGRRMAQVQSIDPLKKTARRMAESQTLDQMIPFVVIGSIAGLILGLIVERYLPIWISSYWLYGIIVIIILWGLPLGMPPWVMP